MPDKQIASPVHEYRRSADQDVRSPAHYPLIVVGAGPIGMGAGIDAAIQGIGTVVLDANDPVRLGARAGCQSQRALEILDRLGVAQRLVDKGITWNVGRVFFRDRQVFEFNLLPQPDHHRPAFVNIEQSYLADYLVDRAAGLPELDIRWNNRVTGVLPKGERVEVTIDTPEGPYFLTCEYLVVADGANSSVGDMLGLESTGQVFRDRFLIADVVMKAEEVPTERWFWFDPPFHPGQCTLLDPQADNVWRIHFQLGWDADPEREKRPECVVPCIEAMLGDDRPFELQGVRVYTFQCRRMERFRHGRVFFAGDAAHQVSAFGARCANSGIQDVDNLIWKLKLVMDGKAPDALLDTYDDERVPAADENILNATRATDYITPKSEVSRAFRDAVLDLAGRFEFARRLLISGRLSTPCVYRESPLNTRDEHPFEGAMLPGSPAADAPVHVGGESAWLLGLLGNRFGGLYFAGGSPREDHLQAMQELVRGDPPVEVFLIRGAEGGAAVSSSGATEIEDSRGRLAERYDGRPGTFYLVRPDQRVAARWREFDLVKVRRALARATCKA